MAIISDLQFTVQYICTKSIFHSYMSLKRSSKRSLVSSIEERENENFQREMTCRENKDGLLQDGRRYKQKTICINRWT